MEYRKRMADTRDASKSIEWNAALAALDKITPPMALGRPVTPIDIPALQSAISDAMAAGVEYDEFAPFEKVLLDAVKASGEDIARDPALMKLQEYLEAKSLKCRALFDAWDADGSGTLELLELNKILRRCALRRPRP